MNIDYQLIRSARRKTLGLQVKGGKVVVRAPLSVKQVDIERLVTAKSAWLYKHLNAQQQSQPIKSLFESGNDVFVFGDRKILQIGYGSATNVVLDGERLVIELPKRCQLLSAEQHARKVANAFDAWLKTQAQQYLPERLERYSQRMALSFTGYQIKRYKSRWGSCNNKGALSFNSLLMMTPPYVIDYVVVHELAHLKHLNHSASFWALVGNYCPNVTRAKAWLKQHNQFLQWQ